MNVKMAKNFFKKNQTQIESPKSSRKFWLDYKGKIWLKIFKYVLSSKHFMQHTKSCRMNNRLKEKAKIICKKNQKG